MSSGASHVRRRLTRYHFGSPVSLKFSLLLAWPTQWFDDCLALRTCTCKNASLHRLTTGSTFVLRVSRVALYNLCTGELTRIFDVRISLLRSLICSGSVTVPMCWRCTLLSWLTKCICTDGPHSISQANRTRFQLPGQIKCHGNKRNDWPLIRSAIESNHVDNESN